MFLFFLNSRLQLFDGCNSRRCTFDHLNDLTFDFRGSHFIGSFGVTVFFWILFKNNISRTFIRLGQINVLLPFVNFFGFAGLQLTLSVDLLLKMELITIHSENMKKSWRGFDIRNLHRKVLLAVMFMVKLYEKFVVLSRFGFLNMFFIILPLYFLDNTCTPNQSTLPWTHQYFQGLDLWEAIRKSVFHSIH